MLPPSSVERLRWKNVRFSGVFSRVALQDKKFTPHCPTNKRIKKKHNYQQYPEYSTADCTFYLHSPYFSTLQFALKTFPVNTTILKYSTSSFYFLTWPCSDCKSAHVIMWIFSSSFKEISIFDCFEINNLLTTQLYNLNRVGKLFEVSTNTIRRNSFTKSQCIPIVINLTAWSTSANSFSCAFFRSKTIGKNIAIIWYDTQGYNLIKSQWISILTNLTTWSTNINSLSCVKFRSVKFSCSPPKIRVNSSCFTSS